MLYWYFIIITLHCIWEPNISIHVSYFMLYSFFFFSPLLLLSNLILYWLNSMHGDDDLHWTPSFLYSALQHYALFIIGYAWEGGFICCLEYYVVYTLFCSIIIWSIIRVHNPIHTIYLSVGSWVKKVLPPPSSIVAQTPKNKHT